MSKVIFKLKFESPNFKTTKANNMYHLLYIGTREGVALNDDMKEFEGKNNKTSNDEYMKYIADRPRSHGLFGNSDVSDIKKKANEMRDYNGYVYRGIISLRETEAIEKGYDNRENWEELVRDKMFYISKQLNIPYQSLEWVGAFHRESGHPHVHLMMWNKEEEVRNIGTIPKRNVEAIRKELTKEIFDNEFENALSLKNIYRDFLIDTTKLDVGNNEVDKMFLEVGKRVDEVNTKFEVSKLEDDIRVINKEISENNNEDVINEKKELIKELKNKIDKDNIKIKMYSLEHDIDTLVNTKESAKLEKEILLARKNGGIDELEKIIGTNQNDLGIYSLQQKRKVSSNRLEVIKMKCELTGLINKQKMLDIESDFKKIGIDINSEQNEQLSKEQLEIKNTYIKLKVETEDITLDDYDKIEEKIYELSGKFKENRWKLGKGTEGEAIENNLHKIQNGIAYLNKEYYKQINEEYENDIENFTSQITELKKKEINIAKNSFNIDKTNIYELERILKTQNKKYNIPTMENKLKKMKQIDVSNDKIKKLEVELHELQCEFKNAPVKEIDNLKKDISNIKSQIEKEKDIYIDEQILKFQGEYEAIKNEVGTIDVGFNEYIIGDRLRGKTLEEIGEMLVELDVPRMGRLQYKFMPPEIKDNIDKITDTILSMPQYLKLYDGYIKSVESLTRLYTDKEEDVEQAINNAREDIYKRIGNNILKAKREMLVDRKKPDFVAQNLLINIIKLFAARTNQNEKTKLVCNEKSKAQRKKEAQENKARGLYSEYQFE